MQLKKWRLKVIGRFNASRVEAATVNNEVFKLGDRVAYQAYHNHFCEKLSWNQWQRYLSKACRQRLICRSLQEKTK